MIKTAIIPAAGYGTRMLPVTKVISKEMLPVGNKPIIDYVVDDLVAAGIERIVIVVQPGETQIRDYFSQESTLKSFLKQRDALHKYRPIENLPEKAEFIFVEQDMSADKYGTTIPLITALEKIGDDEPVLFVNGDSLPWTPKADQTKLFIDAWMESEMGAALMSIQVPLEEVEKYGVIDFDKTTSEFKKIVEHPSVEEAPSNYINTGNYIFPSGVLGVASRVPVDKRTGEYLVIDVVNELLDEGVMVHTPASNVHYLDVGNVANFVHSNQIVADTDL